MNKMIFAVLASVSFAVTMFGATAFADSGYVCKKKGSYVCVQSLATGQCTQSFSRSDFDNPMFACQKYLGSKVGSYDPRNYSCYDAGHYVCAVDGRTGQCTHSWSRSEFDNPMFQCRKFTGQGVGAIDKSGYRCRKGPSWVCAEKISTGQCTHQWRTSEYDNPMWMCKKWLGRN